MQAQHPTVACRFVVSLLTFVLVSQSCQAAFTIQFDPNQTTVQSNGSDQTFEIDLLITHDGSASPTTFSGMTIDMINPGAELTLDMGQDGDFDFSNDARVKLSTNTGLYSFGGSSTGQQFSIASGTTSSLMKMNFNLDGAVTSGTFDLNLSLRDAKRGLANNGSLMDIAPEVNLISGLFTVNNAIAVPEPGFVWVGCLATLWVSRKRFRL